MMKNGDYWRERFKLVEEAQNRLGLQCYEQIEQQYRLAQRQLEAQISTWYQRFADNNGITLAEARRMLTGRELEELKWDVSQYIKYGKENATNKMWMKQLENASARYHVSRLEALKLQTQQSLETLFGNQLDTIDSAMKGIYTSGYYHTAFEIQKGAGVAWDFAALDENKIRKVINRPWAADGRNFSERVWQNRQKLVSELNTELTQNIILGQDPQKAIDAIAKKMGTSKSNAGRLVMTEEAFFSSAAQRDCFSELGVEKYEIVATLDSNTSEICREMDGRVFPMSQWEVGVTAPPFHVRCRTTTVPAFGDEFDSIGERAARDPETGKTCYVPADMTYPEWKEKYVDKAGQKGTPQTKTAAGYLIRSHTPGQDITAERKIVEDTISSMPKKVREALERGTIIDIGKDGASQYDYDHDIIYINKGAAKNAVIHEIGHMVENKLLDSRQVAILRKKMVGNVNAFEIVPEIYGDGSHNEVEVFLLKKETFVSDYQGRIYVDSDNILEAFDKDGNFRDDLLWEFVSEGYAKYVENPEALKEKCPEMFALIEEAVQ